MLASGYMYNRRANECRVHALAAGYMYNMLAELYMYWPQDTMQYACCIVQIQILAACYIYRTLAEMCIYHALAA